ncbi:DUF2207 domain-containing protein, partial [Candidatus Micrarchaeota archaeon]|nr:DUF2207 domain-containing protein [Candidatus Micrarchaeota archaeon]
MPRRYIFLILILFMFILPLSYAKSFYITDANVTYTIYPQGYVHVVEDVEYFLDCDYEHFHELYRELPRGLSFDNASGYCMGDNCTFRYDSPEYSLSGNPELILELGNGCGVVTAHFEYNVYTLIKHKDNVQFYYKVWGDKSPQVRRLSVNIILPKSVNDTIYFIHPWDSKVAIVNTTNGIILHSSNYPSQTFLEINLLMPLKWFDNSSSYITGTSSKEEIIRNENIDKVLFYIGKIIEIIVLILLFLAIFFPWVFGVYCYYKYGRELAQNELGYSALYEREPPSDHSPAEVASIVSGDYDFEHSLQATIISLAAKGWIDIKKKGDDYVIVFNDAGKRIKDFEKDVYDELKKHATLSSKTNKEKVLSINHFKKRVAPTRTFYYWHKSWVSKLKKNISI